MAVKGQRFAISRSLIIGRPVADLYCKFIPPGPMLWLGCSALVGGKASVTQRINDKEVVRTTPATPGLLINLTQYMLKAGVSQKEIFINDFSLFTVNCKPHMFVGPLKSEGFIGFV